MKAGPRQKEIAVRVRDDHRQTGSIKSVGRRREGRGKRSG